MKLKWDLKMTSAVVGVMMEAVEKMLFSLNVKKEQLVEEEF